jgi:hypothetical protein
VDALEAVGDRQQSIRVLEEATTPASEEEILWVRNQARLLQFYRESGMDFEARPVERRLRAMLSEADPDFWMRRLLTF